MNRFRTRKKGKEAQNAQDDKEGQPLPLFTSKAFKRAKKPQVETTPELDLSSALPSSDDFRTSLLMPNLSARFSMLREQDDPNSKIGKANDDSVLLPKRASRLNVFGQGNNPLGDIAEVSSLHGSSARPSFAIGRGSFASGEGYATDDGDFSPGGSVMSRSRPGEGNNLFGGRQKVYKIPVASTTPRSGSTSEASGTGGGMGGKAVYENDVTLSAFQKLRAKEKEQQQQQQLELELEMQQNRHDTEDEGSLTSRPSVNRTSTSNTSVDSAQRNSGQGTNSPIASKAVFSPIKPNLTSTGMERNPTKPRRYGQGIEPNTQQPSAITRLESLSRQRAGVNDSTQINRSLSKSTTSLNERFQHRQPVYASSGFHPTSPPPSAPTTIAEAVDVARKGEPEKSPVGNPGFGVSSQLSPPISESEEQRSLRSLEAALQPEDRGKATAMGLFNKPATQYDDTKFSQRQRQMYEGRDTPPLGRRSPPPPAVDAEHSAPSRQVSNSTHRPKVDTLVSQYNNPQNETRLSGGKSTTTNSSRRPSPSPSRLKPINGAFLSGGDSGSEDEREPTLKNMLAAVQSLENIHPAFRSRSNSGDSSQSSLNRGSHADTPELRYSETRDLNTIQENEGTEEPVGDAPDSPTLGPLGLGLSGLVRTHLRHDSDTSIYPPPSPGISKIKDTARELNPAVKAARDSDHAASVHSNPWEYDDLYKLVSPASDNKEPAKQTGQPDFSSMSMRAKQMLGQATALRIQTQAHVPSPAGPPDNSNISPPNHMRDQSSRGPTSHSSPWQEEHKPRHQRGASSETQNEREELANELAERRKKVQEKLRSFAESESRSGSPSSGHRFHDYSSGPKHGNAFAMLKNKTGRNPMGGRADAPQSKAMKMLGMDNSFNSSSPILPTSDSWLDDEERASRNRGRESRSGSPHLGARNHNRPWHPQGSIRGRVSQDGSRESFTGDPSPPSHRSSGRTRSSSDVSGRSKSQPRYRDDLEPVGEHTIGHGEVQSEELKSSKASASVSSSSRPSEEVSDYRSSERSTSGASGRYRSNSRSAAQGYYDPNPPIPLQTHQSDLIGNPPRPSPVTPYSANATPPLNEASPIHASTSTPTLVPPMNISSSQRNQGLGGAHKRVIDKSKISEPTFLSSTSNVPTVGLPPGASLTNGSTPPIPPMNPRRRRQTTTQTFINAFKSSDRYDQPSMPGSNPTGLMDEQLHQQQYHQHHSHNNHQSIFSEEEKRPRPRQKLRKISSEGGNLNAKARQQLMNNSSPALPQLPKKLPMEGGMF
ncbi:hypothetical protein BDDG_01528 [Blastomyces dermatitidis ATCC 18188]|uniref:Uncharacterized protein n=1 Tax=Ajellomyces dermatitidis (strain ATCC 18188 / CBS 674.68) TaxID=653446 RepID=F2T5S8_AJEDA|nr:hypothetical protein BDDG_01528 [Blastomyces dermatitidis ATCC 18188]